MYNINDCVLIRKTTRFPSNNIVQTPLNGMAYSFGRSSIMGDALLEKIRKMNLGYEEMIEELKKYDVYFETYRSTIHFTINGVVSNSLYGEFNYPYAIIEPLKYHIDEESLLGLRVEDTYFTDDIKLSNESIVLVPFDEAMSLEEKYDFNGMNIRTYTGDIEEAIKEVLAEMNYDFFAVNDHGYQNGLNTGTKDSEMFNFIAEYSREHGISQARHFYSDVKLEDEEIRLREAETTDLKHLMFILESGLVSDKLVERIKSLLADRRYLKKEFDGLMSELIEEVGLNNLQVLTNEFNKLMIDERNQKLAKKSHELT